MIDITTIGEILIDLTLSGQNAEGVGLFAAYPGGAPANVAVAAARLGASTAFLGKVGNDVFGERLREALQDNGVDVSGVSVAPVPTTMAVVTLSSSGESTYSFLRGADNHLTPEEVDEAMLDRTRILHFGLVSLTAGASRPATIFAARYAHHHGVLVTYAPNYRSALWPTERDAAEWLKIPLPLVDVIKLSRKDLTLAAGTADPEEGSRTLAGLGVPLVIITLGADGAFYRWRDKTGLVPGVPCNAADVNGAGDSFFGAVLSRLARRGEKPLAGLECGELEDILSFGNRCASITCGRPGAIPAMPTLDEAGTSMTQRS